ncbi:TrmH family RNA methyltransferase [Staphylococcus warneri]|uniref:TrmH family RNA methyltransferase n=1 Tax=Staphylococcus warneri TaxID=1292 RepID=UPI00103DB4F0|nr:TrmH family RNA methyltransferase [Staphylococcus warneri]TBW78884.1 hypothetical protein EQ810_12200 [Staphylococcus warneri]
MIKTINKLKCEEFKELRFLKSNKNKFNQKKIVLFSFDQIKQALEFKININYIVTTSKDILSFAKSNNIDCFETQPGILNKLHNSKTKIDVLAVCQRRENSFLLNNNVIILDNIIDHGNIGTIIRTGVAYNYNYFLYPKYDFYPYTNKILNASRCTNLISNFKNFESNLELYKFLKDNGFLIVTTSPHGPKLNEEKLTYLKENYKIALILGNEQNGVGEFFIKNSDYNFCLELQNNIESLNVGVFAGILFDKLNK